MGLFDRDELSKTAKNEKKERFENIRERAGTYKKFWDKNGVIQYKTEHIAILHRTVGLQIQFIVAFDDLTKEGYRLMAHDDNMGAGTGGINSYFYFQKTKYVN